MSSVSPPRLIGVPAWEPGEFSCRQWPDWSFWWDPAVGGSTAGRGRVTAVVVNACAALGLVPAVLGLLGTGSALGTVLAGVVVCYGLSFPLAVWFGPALPPSRRVATVVVVLALGVAPALLLGAPDRLTGSTYAITIGLMLLPLRWSMPLGFATAAVQIGWMWLRDGDVRWIAVGTLVGLTAVLGMVFALLFTIGQLRAARDQAALLAASRERERVARDLHDILGHSLSTMTVKAGLARRTIESAGDVERVAAEIRDVEDLSRRALSDVRATVSGYRTVTLATEIAGARVALGAAGVRAELPWAVDDVDPGLREVFGYVVREAVTNVIRHSDATSCRIRLGRDWIAVTDDGSTTNGPTGPAGNGLAGLTERLTAASGSLEHGRRPGGGFRVVARGPSDARGDVVDAGPAA